MFGRSDLRADGLGSGALDARRVGDCMYNDDTCEIGEGIHPSRDWVGEPKLS